MRDFKDIETVALVAVAIERSNLNEPSPKRGTSGLHDRFISMLLKQDMQLSGLQREARSYKDQLDVEKRASAKLVESRDRLQEKFDNLAVEHELVCLEKRGAQEAFGALHKEYDDLDQQMLENCVPSEAYNKLLDEHERLRADHDYTLKIYEDLKKSFDLYKRLNEGA